MRIEFHLLRLHCRQGLADTIFSSGITYFWGQTGVGKSSIPKLMDYCLAGDFPDTPAIQQEVLRVELHLSVENYNVILQRERKVAAGS